MERSKNRECQKAGKSIRNTSSYCSSNAKSDTGAGIMKTHRNTAGTAHRSTAHRSTAHRSTAHRSTAHHVPQHRIFDIFEYSLYLASTVFIGNGVQSRNRIYKQLLFNQHSEGELNPFSLNSAQSACFVMRTD